MSIIIEIRSTEGGQDAKLLVEDMLDVFAMVIERRRR